MTKVWRVIDRYNAADGLLLASGLAFQATLTLVPHALLISAIAAVVLADPESRHRFIEVVVTFAPPLAGVVNEIVQGLMAAPPTLSIIGIVLAIWGTSRLFASLEIAVSRVFAGSTRRSYVHRTIRRLGAVAIVAVVVTVALFAVPILSIAGDLVRATGPLESVLTTAVLLAMALALATLAMASLYRVLPEQRPTWSAISLPSAGVAVGLLLITRAFTLVAPRLFDSNAIYGTFGALFLGLTWLNLVFVLVLFGAAWVAERARSEGASRTGSGPDATSPEKPGDGAMAGSLP
jgi:membrane protein